MPLDNDIKAFQKEIEGPLHALFSKLYPAHVQTYDRFRKRVGPQCPICKSAAKFMFSSEVQRKGQVFLDSFKSGNWDSYE